MDKQEKADRDMDDGNETKIEKDTDTDSDKTVDKITKEDNSNDGNSNEDITDSSDRTIIKRLTYFIGASMKEQELCQEKNRTNTRKSSKLSGFGRIMGNILFG